jgi:hypothetical protein
MHEIKKIAEVTGSDVDEAPEIELSTFGIAMLAERLEPGSGKRPGRPTDPSWQRVGKLPMTEETQNTLRLLAEKFSTRRRRISPMQVAAYLLEDEVHAYGDALKFLDDTGLVSIWDAEEATIRSERESNWAIIEFTESKAIELPLLWEASKNECLTTSILYAGILREYGHVVIRRDLLDDEQKTRLLQFVDAHKDQIYFHDSIEAFRSSRPPHFTDERVLLKHFDARPIHRFRYPLGVVDQPYLYNLARRFGVGFNVFHATIIGSHGYLDVQLDGVDKADKLVEFARRLGINVRRVHRDDFWDDLALDSEEEIRRSLVAVRGKLEDWRSLPRESDIAVERILQRFREQYELFPGHYTIGKWLFEQATSFEAMKAPTKTGVFTPLQQATHYEIAALVDLAGGPQFSWSTLNDVVAQVA